METLAERLLSVELESDRWYRFSEISYLKKIGVTLADVPELIECLEKWRLQGWHTADNTDYFLPVHAWRALAELKAHDAIEALADLPEACPDYEDWTIEEIPRVLALMGEEVIPELVSIVERKPNQAETASVIIASLSHIGQAEMVPCSQAGLSAISEFFGKQLAMSIEAPVDEDGDLHQRDHPVVRKNSSILCAILDLGLSELAPELESVFSRNLVDVGMAGDWNYLCEELDIGSLGLSMPAKPINSLAGFQARKHDHASEDPLPRQPFTAQEKRVDLKKRRKALAKKKKKRKRQC